MNDFNVQHGAYEGPRGGYAAGTAVEGPRGNVYGRGAAIGPNGGVAAGRGVVGAGGAAAGRGIAVGPGGRVAAGGAVRGPEGGAAARGFVAGPNGYGAGFARVSPSDRYTTATAVRGNFANYGIYGAGWYGAHPGAWYAAGWGAGTAWRAATWSSLGNWLSYVPAAPIYYDYGTNVVYQGDDVYVNGQDAGTAADCYDQATAIAQTGATAPVSNTGNWLPLGVFALSKTGQTNSEATIQLAVDHTGILRGNYTDTMTKQTQVAKGSVDMGTQQAAFTVGDNTTTVYETGLYNLTKEEAPLLVHIGQDRTEQRLLVRLKQNPSQSRQSQ